MAAELAGRVRLLILSEQPIVREQHAVEQNRLGALGHRDAARRDAVRRQRPVGDGDREGAGQGRVIGADLGVDGMIGQARLERRRRKGNGLGDVAAGRAERRHDEAVDPVRRRTHAVEGGPERRVGPREGQRERGDVSQDDVIQVRPRPAAMRLVQRHGERQVDRAPARRQPLEAQVAPTPDDPAAAHRGEKREQQVARAVAHVVVDAGTDAQQVADEEPTHAAVGAHVPYAAVALYCPAHELGDRAPQVAEHADPELRCQVGVGAARKADPHADVRFVDLRQPQRVDVPALRGSEGVLRSRAAPHGYEEEKEEDRDEGSHDCN